jgi:hypothetical protein
MSDNNSMKKRGMRSLQVWIPEGLHDAIREKLFRERKTAMAGITKLLSLWTGWKPNERKDTDTPAGPAAG